MEQEKFWPKADLRLTERESGVIVEQRGRQYLARKWQLTNDLINVVQQLIDNGLTVVMRDKPGTDVPVHPSRKKLNTASGVPYISFSYHRHDRWVVALDQYSKPPSVQKVTIEKMFRPVLSGTDIRWIWETHGGKNLFLPSDELLKFLHIIDPNTVKELNERIEGRTTTNQHRSPITEAELQDQLIAALQNGEFHNMFGEIETLEVQSRFSAANNPYTLNQSVLIPDVIVTSNDITYIIELKKGEAGAAEAQQLFSYVAAPEVQSLNKKGRVIGKLIADRFSRGALDFVTSQSERKYEVELIEHGFDSRLTLTRIDQILG